MLEKTYQPAAVEERIYRQWEDAGAFACGRPELLDGGATAFSIVIPPPNVTGSLHMGHALNNTIQDILARFERLRGKDVLWQPGMDHAGIATQMVVERQLMEEQQPDRRTMGREAFVKRIWEWKDESGGTIINQLKRLGASCDWRRERFTMDEGLSRAVLKVFVELYQQGLIYKDKRLVNWDPKLLTAISDLEVQQVETKGHLWHFKYPIKQPGRTKYIVVATTRPETMLGDTAVAVHPDDKRWKKYVGKTCILPLVGREIPIIADEHADPEQGSGAVKITPAHDFNDFEVWKRHKDKELKGGEPINIFDPAAHLTFQGNSAFLRNLPPSDDLIEILKLDGVDRFVARERIVGMLEARGLVEKRVAHVHTVPYGDRSNAVIEPFLTSQWYVDAKTLAKPAIKAVVAGETIFVPKNWEKTYFDWMRKIQPWCISRQLWWGHRIPAWYGRKEAERKRGEMKGWYSLENDPEIFVASTEAEAILLARERYDCEVRVLDYSPKDGLDPIFQQIIDDELAGKSRWEPIWRDEDVLDTWFSSALWPFSTLGWPDKTPELERYYPTDVLVTGFDIIFFWVARMMMMGLHFMKEVPFDTVYIHALVRDEKGQKMSKSKGNIIDPLELIDAYGADALRFTLAAMAAQGRDIKLSTSRVEGYRNFATKLWNAARFAEMNECVSVPDFDPANATQTINRWIAGETERTADAITQAIEAHRYNDAANAAYHFVWHIFCDWYLELIKPLLNDGESDVQAETRAMTAWALDRILVLLHPFMPFITEELWARMAEHGPGRDKMLVLSTWPVETGLVDEEAAAEIGWVIELVAAVRSVRSEMNIPPRASMPLILMGASELMKARAERHEETIKRLARVETIRFDNEVPHGSVQMVLNEATVALPLEGIIDIAAECDRLKREIDKVGSEIEKLGSKLANKNFVSRAPEHVVEEQRERKAEAEATANKLRQALGRLEGAA